MVVIVFGLPGSGKSFFASRLAAKIHAEYVTSDRVRKQLFEKRDYSEVEKKAVYDNMLKSMSQAVRKNENIVLDATFHKKATRDLFVHELGSRELLFFIEVQADEEIIKERLKKDRPFSEADYEVYKTIRQKNEPLLKPHLVLQSTNDNITEMLESAVSYLKLGQ